MDTMLPLVFSAMGFILAMASRPGCMVARLFDQVAHWIGRLL